MSILIMAGYPKIWTTIRHEAWFKILSPAQKCIWYEMILVAKEQADNGEITYKNVAHMASDVGCDWRSIGEWLGREATQGRVRLLQKCRKLLHFQLVHYNEAQELRRYKPRKKRPQPEHISLKHITVSNEPYNLENLDISEKHFEKLRRMYPKIDHNYELMQADMRRPEYPSKSKNPNDNAFLTNWFRKADEFKKKDESEEVPYLPFRDKDFE